MLLDSYKNQLQRWEKLALGLQLAKHASIGYIKRTMMTFVKQLEKDTEPGHVLSFIQNQVNPSKGCGIQNCENCVMMCHFIRRQLNKGRPDIICMETREELTEDDLWWTICKIFINQRDIRSSIGPEDVSPQVIVVLMRNCKLFGNRAVSSGEASIMELAEKLNTLRKKLVHCLDKSLSEKDMENAYRTIYDFIMATYDESTSPEALDELQKLKGRGVNETCDDQLERALTMKTEKLEHDTQHGQTAGNSVEGSQESDQSSDGGTHSAVDSDAES